MSNTKEKILKAALDLFSKEGYEAVSVDNIAKAIGIKAPSLYKHFKNKNDIYKSLINKIDKDYNEHSLFAKEFKPKEKTKETFSVDETIDEVQNHISYIINNDDLVKVRQFMSIEQYRNPEIAKLLMKHSYDDVMNYHIKLMKYLIDKKELIDEDPEMMAAQYCLPITVWIRTVKNEDEMMNKIEKHISQFFKMYRRKHVKD